MLLDEARGQKLFEFSYAKQIGRRPQILVFQGLQLSTPVRSCHWLPLPYTVKMPRTSISENFPIQHLTVLSFICLKDTMTLHSGSWPVLYPGLVQVCLNDCFSFVWHCVGKRLAGKGNFVQFFV